MGFLQGPNILEKLLMSIVALLGHRKIFNVNTFSGKSWKRLAIFCKKVDRVTINRLKPDAINFIGFVCSLCQNSWFVNFPPKHKKSYSLNNMLLHICVIHFQYICILKFAIKVLIMWHLVMEGSLRNPHSLSTSIFWNQSQIDIFAFSSFPHIEMAPG